MAPGITVGGEMMLSERVFGQLICLVGVAGFMLVLVVFTRPFWRGTAQPQEGERIATDNSDEQTGPDWIHVDATPPPEEDKEATPLGERKLVPYWVGVGAPPPSSFDDLIKTTPDALLRCRIPTTCPHNRLNKKGTNAFQARIKCTDCGAVIAQYTTPKASAAPP